MTFALSALRHRLQKRRSFALLWLLACVWAVVPLSLPAKIAFAQTRANEYAQNPKPAVAPQQVRKHGHDAAAASCEDPGTSCCESGGICGCAAVCGTVFMLASTSAWSIVPANMLYVAAAPVTVPARNHGPPLRPPTV